MVEQGHGGFAVAKALKALGVDHLFTLTGSHIFPILDGAHNNRIKVVDTRHEQAAGFAAEGWARLTRTLGVVAVTAGPGVTNVMSPIAQGRANRAPMLVLGGRAPLFRWGQGSLQEMDHVPFVEPIAPGRTIMDPSSVGQEVLAAAVEALSAPTGPRFVDAHFDILLGTSDLQEFEPPQIARAEPDASQLEAVAKMLAGAERPVIVAGSGVWLDRAEGALRSLAESADIPVVMNGQGRGILPADHRLAVSRSRRAAFDAADVVIVAGTPFDFRLGFGQGFSSSAKVIHVESHESLLAQHVDLAAAVGGSIASTFEGLSSSVGKQEHGGWVDKLRAVENDKAERVQDDLRSDATPIHPMRVYGELASLLDPDTIVVCDGGDFVSYAGREVPIKTAGTWLDPGPYGCLGSGPGYAIAAALANPGRPVVLILGDGAVGFSGMELETMVRLGLPILCVVGNNGIMALERNPMRGLFGYDIAADINDGVRYDRLMEALGGRGERITEPGDLGVAMKRGLASDEPTLLDVVIDPEVIYPRAADIG